MGDPSRDLHSATRSQGLDYTTTEKKRLQNKTWGNMMKMRRRNCYADVITKAEGETDRPHYGSCINVNQLLLTFPPFFYSFFKKKKRKMDLVIF